MALRVAQPGKWGMVFESVALVRTRWCTMRTPAGRCLRAHPLALRSVTIQGSKRKGKRLFDAASQGHVLIPMVMVRLALLTFARPILVKRRVSRQTNCDFGHEACVTRQRHHILVRKVDGVWIEHNQMSGGGRIKTGGAGLGRNMHIRHNALDFVNDNRITIVDRSAGVTEHVEITGNTIINPVTSGIFFGADGPKFAAVPGMILRDVTIARNRISGFFSDAGIVGKLPLTAENTEIQDNFIENRRDTAIQRYSQMVLA